MMDFQAHEPGLTQNDLAVPCPPYPKLSRYRTMKQKLYPGHTKGRQKVMVSLFPGLLLVGGTAK